MPNGAEIRFRANTVRRNCQGTFIPIAQIEFSLSVIHVS